MYCNRLHASWSTQSRLATLLSSLIVRWWVGLQTLWWFRLKDLSIDEMVEAWCFGCLSGPPIIFVLFLSGRLRQSGSKYHHESAITIPLVGRWWPNIECWLCSFVIFHGIQTSIAKKPYIFCDFSGEGGWDPCPPLWIRAWVPFIS